MTTKQRIKIAQITELQREYGVLPMQEAINSGAIWTKADHIIQKAVISLNLGICMFPKERFIGPHGQPIPSRLDIRPYSAGSLRRCQRFWEDEYIVHFKLN